MEKIRFRAFIYVCFILLATLLSTACFAADESQDTLDKIRQSGVLHWGSDAEGGAPYEFFDPNQPDKLIGFEVDIARAIAKKLGVKAEMYQNEWTALVPALNAKNFDIIIAGLEITDNRKRVINFTRPYYIYSQQIVVNKKNTTIHKKEDLIGKKVGTLSATAALRILEDLGGVNIVNYPGVVGPYKDLTQERTDAVLLDLPIAQHYAKPMEELKFVGEPFGEGLYGIGVRKEDKRLLNELNKIIGELLESGELEEIYRNWEIWTKAQDKLAEYTETEIVTGNAINTFENLDKYIPLLLNGTWVTIKLSVISMILAILIGLFLAIVRMYAPLPLSFLSSALVEILRGTPLLIQLYIIYYGLPNLGIKLEPFSAAIIGLSLNYAAYEAENYRAGIQAVPEGQMEAALALGMTKTMALRKVIIPQAVRIVIPPVSNDFIALFKDSSLVSVITMVELTKVYSYLATSTYDYIGLGIVVAGIYFILSYSASLLAKRIEKNLAYGAR